MFTFFSFLFLLLITVLHACKQCPYNLISFIFSVVFVLTLCCLFFFFFRSFMILCDRSTDVLPPRNPRNLNDQNVVVLFCGLSIFSFYTEILVFLVACAKSRFLTLFFPFSDFLRSCPANQPTNAGKSTEKEQEKMHHPLGQFLSDSQSVHVL